MAETVSKGEFHGRILRDTFGSRTGEGDGLLLFSILHSYQLVLSGPVLEDGPREGEVRVPAHTQRGCASAVAELYTGERTEPMYWYFRWNEWGAYSKVDDLSDDERARTRELMRRMQAHPFLSGFAFEDEGYDPAGFFETAES